MDGSTECPICSEVYDHKKRVPKVLVTCGHGMCESCVRSLLATDPGPTISCPECRTPCQIPNGRADKLPTNFSLLRILDSLCSECMDRKYTQRCGHCTLNLCDICRENHYIQALPKLSENMGDLKELVEHLQDIINKEKDFESIQSKGEDIVDEMQKSHKELIRQLDQEHEKNIAQVRAAVLHHTDLSLEWREQLMKLLTDCKVFLDKHNKVRTRLPMPQTHHGTVNNTHQECQQKLEALRQIEAAKPDPQYLTESFKDINIDKVVASYREHITSQMTQTDGNTQGCTDIPDYTKATCKSMFVEGLVSPIDVCTDPVSGNIIVTDINQHKVYVLTDTLQLVHSLGSQGQGPGEFTCPWGVAADDGNIFISDRDNHRICVTYTKGAFLYTFGSKGTGRDHYNYPHGLSFDRQGLLYVCDSNNHRIKVTDKQGTYIRDFGQNVFGDGCPWYIAVSTDDKVAVTTNDGDLYLFSTDGQHTHAIEKETHNVHATDICFDGHDNVLLSDYSGGRVVVMSDQLEVKSFIDLEGSGPEQLCWPYGLTVTKNGGIAVCDLLNKRLLLYVVPRESGS